VVSDFTSEIPPGLEVAAEAAVFFGCLIAALKRCATQKPRI
jgi:hypothetical protein